MNTIKISAVLTAALLTGALSATAFAAETLTTTTGSITFRKAIDVTNAAGAGGITGTIAFDVTAADEAAVTKNIDKGQYTADTGCTEYISLPIRKLQKKCHHTQYKQITIYNIRNLIAAPINHAENNQSGSHQAIHN